MRLNPEECTPLRKGYTDFENLCRDGILFRGVIIRVYNYSLSAPDEPHFVLGEDNVLFRVNGEDVGKKFNYKDALSEEAAPCGWCIEGFDPTALPDDEMKKYVRDM